MKFDHWQFTWILNLWIVMLCVLVLVIMWVIVPYTIMFFKKEKVTYKSLFHEKSTYISDMTNGYFFASMMASILASAAIVGIIIASLIPADAKYKAVYSVSGTISDIHQQFTDGTGSLVSDYIVRINGNPQQYIVNDPRLTSLKTGDHVNMWCTWQWNQGYSADQINCNLSY